jgi:uncharacterized protein (DUF1330 family)
MSAYVIGDIEVTDPRGLRGVPQAGAGGGDQVRRQFIVRGGKFDAQEGGWNRSASCWSSSHRSRRRRKWYDSPEYAPLIKLRQKGLEGPADHRRGSLEKRKGVLRRPFGPLLLQ